MSGPALFFNQSLPKAIDLSLGSFQGPLSSFDPIKHLSVLVNGLPQVVVDAFYLSSLNVYRLFLTQDLLEGQLVQVLHHPGLPSAKDINNHLLGGMACIKEVSSTVVFLNNEIGWIQNQIVPFFTEGTLTKVAASPSSALATGTWTVVGYTPPSTPVTIDFSSQLSGAFDGPASGTIVGLTGSPSAYRVDTYSVTDSAYFQESATPNGSWGWSVSRVRGGRKLAKLIRISDSAVIATTDGPDTGYEVQLWITTDAEYLQKTAPARSDGTWDSTGFLDDSPTNGLYHARLVRKSDSHLMAKTATIANLVRSYIIPSGDPSFAALKDRCFLYDQAVALIASLAYRGTSDLCDKLAQALCSAFNTTRNEFPFSVDHMTGVAADAYFRMGSHAWGTYALALYKNLRPSGYNVTPTLTLALNRIVTNMLPSGPTQGLLQGGRGAYPSGVYADTPITWVSTEHNIDCWFALNEGFKALGTATYATKAEIIRVAILANLWASSRFNQGYGDTADSLDINSWGALWLEAVGDHTKALLSVDNMTAFRMVQDGIIGYTPYLPTRGYPGFVPNVWSEGSFGASLSLKRISGVTYGQELLPLRGSDSGWTYCLSADSSNELSNWPSVAGTGWSIIAMNENISEYFWKP